jgi:hypothetical protein
MLIPGDHLPFRGLGAGQAVRGLKGRRSRTASFRPVRNPSASGRAWNDLQCSRPSTAHRTLNRAPEPLPSFAAPPGGADLGVGDLAPPG